MSPSASPFEPAPGAGAVGVDPRLFTRPLVVLALVWIAGIGLGRSLEWLAGWTVLAILLSVVALVLAKLRCDRATRCWAFLALVAVSAGWTVVRHRFLASDDIRQFIGAESQLVQVTGVVEGPTYLSSPQRGAFGQFNYRAPATLLVLKLDAIRLDNAERPASGRLLLKLEEADHRLQPGERIRATGWLSGIMEPANPGERDYRATLADRGIVGRLVLRRRGNWESLGRSWLGLAPQRLADQAAWSLQLGMSYAPARAALLETLLLGRRSPDLVEIDQAFRRVGLAHLLSISGAHLTILLGLVWFLATLATSRPARAAAMVLTVLTLYLLIVPPQLPLVRAGIMAAALCLGYASGRRVSGFDMLALAALLILLARPDDLFNAGFQLSFLGVAGLILFTRPVAQWIYPDPLVPTRMGLRRFALLRWGADLLAADVVAAMLTLPLVAYHFGMVSPLAVVLTLLMLPLMTAALSLGFLKMVVGLGLPTFGALLAAPLAWVTDIMAALVEHASRWPLAWIEVSPPGPIWTLATLGLIVACFLGLFERRRLALLAAVGLSSLWLFSPSLVESPRATLIGDSQRPRLRVNMLSVGNGSCFLVRLDPGPWAGGAHVLMFDCGSQEYLDMGERTVAPALRSLGVGRIDTLVISHADMDHFCGSLDLMDHLPVGRVLASPQVLAEARSHPQTPVAALVEGIAQRGVPIVEVCRGWRGEAGGAELAMIWPPRDLATPRHNDMSLVLSIRAAGRRLLLNGDIQQIALTMLLEEGPEQLRADITDLPHHGSFSEASPAWLLSVSPSVVLQSTGMTRLIHDKWSGFLPPPMTRLITHRQGMAQVDVAADGRITCSTFRAGVAAGR